MSAFFNSMTGTKNTVFKHQFRLKELQMHQFWKLDVSQHNALFIGNGHIHITSTEPLRMRLTMSHCFNENR